MIGYEDFRAQHKPGYQLQQEAASHLKMQLFDEVELVLKYAKKRGDSQREILLEVLDVVYKCKNRFTAMDEKELEQILDVFDEYWDSVDATSKQSLLQDQEVSALWKVSINYMKTIYFGKRTKT